VTDAYVRTTTAMGTVVTAHVVGGSGGADDREATTMRALDWFDRVERTCSRFDPETELARLGRQPGESVPVSDILFETVRFALAVAEESGGAFDPTVGHALASAGFNREYRTGHTIASSSGGGGDYRDIHLDEHEKTITLDRPVSLDFGGVAKGFAVDLAARELRNDGFENFVIDAGGDLYVAGHNANDEPWSVGIRHPRAEGGIIETLRVSDVGLCTSGDYERLASRSTNAAVTHHLVDPRTHHSAGELASVTVLAPGAMIADALSTAVFVLGPVDGIALLRRQKVRGFV